MLNDALPVDFDIVHSTLNPPSSLALGGSAGAVHPPDNMHDEKNDIIDCDSELPVALSPEEKSYVVQYLVKECRVLLTVSRDMCPRHNISERTPNSHEHKSAGSFYCDLYFDVSLPDDLDSSVRSIA